MTPTKPPTARLLKMLLPKILPIISSFIPRRLAAAAVTSSGRDVPAATNVSPTNPEPRSKASAKRCAPSTSSCALPIVPTSPMISQKMSRRGRLPREADAGASGISTSGISSEPASLCWPRRKSLSHSVPNRPANNPASTPSRMIPSNKCSPSCTSKANKPTAPTEIMSSRFNKARRIGTGAKRAAAPRTSVTFATFEPMILPMPRSLSPLAAAIPETAISGALVPKPTITAPIMTGEIR